MISDTEKVDWKNKGRDGEGVHYRNDYQMIESESAQTSDIDAKITSDGSSVVCDSSSISNESVILEVPIDLDERLSISSSKEYSSDSSIYEIEPPLLPEPIDSMMRVSINGRQVIFIGEDIRQSFVQH